MMSVAIRARGGQDADRVFDRVGRSAGFWFGSLLLWKGQTIGAGTTDFDRTKSPCGGDSARDFWCRLLLVYRVRVSAVKGREIGGLRLYGRIGKEPDVRASLYRHDRTCRGHSNRLRSF